MADNLENSTNIFSTAVVNTFEDNSTQVYNTETINTFEENSTQYYNAEVVHTARVHIILYGIGIIIDITAICGNTLTMVTIAKFKQLRTKSNAIIFSLSVADFLFGIINLIENILLIMGEQLSKVFDRLATMFVLSSMLHLLIITLERYIFINHPLKYDILITKTITGSMIAVPWLVSFLTFIIPLIMFFLQTPTNTKALRMVILTGYITESIIIIVMYTKVLQTVKKQVKQIRILSFIRREKCINESDRKATITMGLVVCAFVISWMPERLYSLLIKLNVLTKNQTIYLALELLGYCNSVVNCFIYAWKNTQFRKAYYCLLCCKKMSSGN